MKRYSIMYNVFICSTKFMNKKGEQLFESSGIEKL